MYSDDWMCCLGRISELQNVIRFIETNKERNYEEIHHFSEKKGPRW